MGLDPKKIELKKKFNVFNIIITGNKMIFVSVHKRSLV